MGTLEVRRLGETVTCRPFSLDKDVNSSTGRSLYEADDQPKGKILPLIYYLSPSPIQCFIVPLSSENPRGPSQLVNVGRTQLISIYHFLLSRHISELVSFPTAST